MTISINTNPVSAKYADKKTERIIEFSSKAGGGLISFRIMPNGGLRVSVYRHDATVDVFAGAR